MPPPKAVEGDSAGGSFGVRLVDPNSVLGLSCFNVLPENGRLTSGSSSDDESLFEFFFTVRREGFLFGGGGAGLDILLGFTVLDPF